MRHLLRLLHRRRRAAGQANSRSSPRIGLLRIALSECELALWRQIIFRRWIAAVNADIVTQLSEMQRRARYQNTTPLLSMWQHAHHADRLRRVGRYRIIVIAAGALPP